MGLFTWITCEVQKLPIFTHRQKMGHSTGNLRLFSMDSVSWKSMDWITNHNPPTSRVRLSTMRWKLPGNSKAQMKPSTSWYETPSGVFEETTGECRPTARKGMSDKDGSATVLPGALERLSCL